MFQSDSGCLLLTQGLNRLIYLLRIFQLSPINFVYYFHRIGFVTHQLESVLEGDLDELTDALIEAERKIEG